MSMTPLQRELHDFILDEILPGHDQQSITVDDDLIQRGIVDSLGVQQLMDFCESRYGIRVSDDDLVPENFRTLPRLADFVDRKRAERSAPGRLKLRSRHR